MYVIKKKNKIIFCSDKRKTINTEFVTFNAYDFFDVLLRAICTHVNSMVFFTEYNINSLINKTGFLLIAEYNITRVSCTRLQFFTVRVEPVTTICLREKKTVIHARRSTSRDVTFFYSSVSILVFVFLFF